MNKELPEVVPAISIAREYGEHVSSFDVDILEIVAYLRERGLSDAAIESLDIVFEPGEGLVDGEVLYGLYDRDDDAISVFAIPDVCATRHPDQGHEKMHEDINGTLVHELEHKIGMNDPLLQRALERHYRRDDFVKWSKRIGLGLAGAALGRVLARKGMRHTQYQHDYRVRAGAMAAGGAAVLYGATKAGVFERHDWKYYITDPDEMRAREVEEHVKKEFVAVELKIAGAIPLRRGGDHASYGQAA